MTLPKLTLVTWRKPEPVIVTNVRPMRKPDFGATLMMRGRAGSYRGAVAMAFAAGHAGPDASAKTGTGGAAQTSIAEPAIMIIRRVRSGMADPRARIGRGPHCCCGRDARAVGTLSAGWAAGGLSLAGSTQPGSRICARCRGTLRKFHLPLGAFTQRRSALHVGIGLLPR